VGNVLTDADLQARIAGQFDLILSNIVADVVIALCPMVRQWLKDDGLWIASGIIAERADEVFAAQTRAGFARIEDLADGEWRATLCGKV
jgi:ribosomal protein L11 methyltransferase